MKKNLLPFLAFTLFFVMLFPHVKGQTYPNFALGEGSTQSSSAVVRNVDSLSVIASYKDAGGIYRLARVDLASIVSARLDRDHSIRDIRVVGDEVFFCGYNESTRHGFIGHAKTNDIQSHNPHIIFEELKVDSVASSLLWRLAAYPDNTGGYRLVAIGEMSYYITPLNPAPNNVYHCSDSSHCSSTFVIEYTYSGIFNHVGNRVLNDRRGHFEYACDLVETDNYLAVATYGSMGELVIHRCNKYGVISTFNDIYSYVMPSTEGIWHCCKMNQDIIAIVSLFSPGGLVYETHMRMVDLFTLNMPNAQSITLLDKEEPEEIIYLPNYATLVMLQYHKFNPTDYHYTYFYWLPRKTSSYTMDKIFENDDRRFYSLDQLTSKHIVSTGGEYWLMKDVSFNDPYSSCYTIKNQNVNMITTTTYSYTIYPYLSTSITGTSALCREQYDQYNMRATCTTY